MVRRAIVVVAAATCLATPAVTSGQVQDLVIVSLATKPSVVLGEPVILRFLVLNCLGAPATFDMGYDTTGAFSIRITPPNAEPVPIVTDKSLNPAGGVSRGPRARVEQFSEYRQAILLNERFQFVSAGVHRIEVELATEFMWPKYQQPYRESFTFDLVVHERDVRVLESVAGEFAVRLMSTANAQERIETATALTYVADPVAIPAIRQVLAVGRSNDILLIPGLRRIDSEETRQLLRELAETPVADPPRAGTLPGLERAALARGALAALEWQSRAVR